MEDGFSHFSRVAENYSRDRPRYPRQLIEWLKTECGLSPADIIADIACGTGQMAELFLENGNCVYGIEPNLDMRRFAEKLLRSSPNMRVHRFL